MVCYYTWRVNEMQCIHEDKVQKNGGTCVGADCTIYRKVNNEIIYEKIKENNEIIKRLENENIKLMNELY